MKRRDRASKVALAWSLDFDDIGPQQAQQPCAVGSGKHVRDVQDCQPGERFGDEIGGIDGHGLDALRLSARGCVTADSIHSGRRDRRKQSVCLARIGACDAPIRSEAFNIRLASETINHR